MAQYYDHWPLLRSPLHRTRVTLADRGMRKTITDVTEITKLSILTVFAEEAVWEAEFAGALIGVSAAVTWEQFLLARGLRSHGPVVHKPAAIEEIGHRGEEVPDRVEELGVGGEGPEDQEERGDDFDPHGVCVLAGLDTMMMSGPVGSLTPHSLHGAWSLPPLPP